HNHPLLRNAVCLSLGEYINSAIVMDGVAREGNLEHMQLDASGDICRCGSRGCLEVLCSSRQLTEEGESLPGFFGV
ncbi:ROK family protein, partial [Erysipelatoclostridium ramosum]|nr:ROK family protein [Thomasclavelia ramosa]